MHVESQKLSEFFNIGRDLGWGDEPAVAEIIRTARSRGWPEQAAIAASVRRDERRRRCDDGGPGAIAHERHPEAFRRA